MPGSVFKIVTAIAGLGSGAVTPETTYAEQPGAEKDGLVVDGFTIHDGHHPATGSRALDLVGATEVSCNIWYALTGLATGGDQLTKYAERMGFDAQLPFDLPTAVSQVTGGKGSQPGGFQDDVELANAAYGQGETFVTPLQMALVASTIANRGVLMQPHLVTAITGDGGTRTIDPTQMSTVLSSADARVDRGRDAGGRRGRPRPALHVGRQGPGHPDGRQVRDRGARWHRRAALMVHRLRAGGRPDGRDRRPRRARRARRRGGRPDRG